MPDFLLELEVTGAAELTALPPARLDALQAAESQAARDLAAAGTLVRLWRPPEPGWRNLGIWHAADEAALRRTIASLPMARWMTVRVCRELTSHPNDPGAP